MYTPLDAQPVQNEDCIIVAELGSGHRLNKEASRDLIQAAIDSGADLVKFQHFYADEILHPRAGLIQLPGGSTPLYARFKALEMNLSFLDFLKNTCIQKGGTFFCSPFGIQSAEDLLRIGERSFKVASPELNHLPLLSYLAKNAEKLVLSTGVSTPADIEEALACIRSNTSTPPGVPRTANTSGTPTPPYLQLLHCISAYPAPESEYNLLCIPKLKTQFKLSVGLSDHSRDPCTIPALAALCGAVTVEKHFTLSNANNGLDDSFALTPSNFARLTTAVREATKLKQEPAAPAETRTPRLRPTFPRPDTPADIGSLVHLAHRHSNLAQLPPATIREILGNGSKTLAASEGDNYATTNRSILLVHNRPAGHPLQARDLAILRSEKNLKPGLHPRHYAELIGARLRRKLTGGSGISWDDIAH